MGCLCELVRLQRLERAYLLKHALEKRGVVAEVWHDGAGGARRRAGSPRFLRLMVDERDVVYARWVVAESGLDAWSIRERRGITPTGPRVPASSH